MNHTNAQWVAQSRERPRTEFKGRTSGSNKDILSEVKEKLSKFTDKGTAKVGEIFKVSIINKEGDVVDAWNVKAREVRVISVRRTNGATRGRTTKTKTRGRRSIKAA